MDDIFQNEWMNLGGILSPFNAWLMLRGLRTLSIRMEKISKTVQIVLEHLRNHPAVEKIIYPFDPNHPHFDLAAKQMNLKPGLFSMLLASEDEEAVEKFCNALKVIRIGVSWGGMKA